MQIDKFIKMQLPVAYTVLSNSDISNKSINKFICSFAISSGDEIQTQDPVLGSLVTVVIYANPDAYTEMLTLITPTVNVTHHLYVHVAGQEDQLR